MMLYPLQNSFIAIVCNEPNIIVNVKMNVQTHF